MYDASSSVASSVQLLEPAAPMVAALSPAKENRLKEKKLCAGCDKPVDGQFVRALNVFYHLDCFRCLDCNQVVAEKFFSLKSTASTLIFCEKDYFKRLDLLCAKCGGALRGPHINALSKKYHLEHFSCSVCTTVFRQHDSYYERDGEVFCQFHYSVLFATKCRGCQTAVLQKFVEMNTDSVVEQWHPSCYMIYKLWSVRLASSKHGNAAIKQEPIGDTEEESKRQQITVEKADRILSVLSIFEESAAECISEMLMNFSNNNIDVGIARANKFIFHVESLFLCIDTIESKLQQCGDKSGLHLTREPKQLAKKIVQFFSLLSQSSKDTQESTRDVINLVTTLAHILKMLIRTALNGVLKLERNFGDATAVSGFLDTLQIPSETELKDPVLPMEAKNDLCPVCKKSVEEECIKHEIRRWHMNCFNCSRCHKSCVQTFETATIDDKNLKDVKVFCSDCAAAEGRKGFEVVTQLEQYIFLLRCALKRLCILLKVKKDEQSEISEPTEIRKSTENHHSNLRKTSSPDLTLNNEQYIQNGESQNGYHTEEVPYKPKPLKYISELSGLAHLVVRQLAVMQMHPLVASEIPNLDHLMEFVESRKPSVWSQIASAVNPNKNKPKDGTFGVALDVLVDRYGVDCEFGDIPTRIPIIFDKCIQQLKKMDLGTEGIFRKSGNIRRLKTVSETLDRDPYAIDFADDNPVQIAALMKKFLRELPEPLLTFKLHKLFILSQKMPTEEQKKEVIHLVICLLPKSNLDLLIAFCAFLREVAMYADDDDDHSTSTSLKEDGHSTGNRMNIMNLARVISPNILYSKSKNPVDDESMKAIEAFTMVLRYQEEFWMIPKTIVKELQTNWPDVVAPEQVWSRDVQKEVGDLIKSTNNTTGVEDVSVEAQREASIGKIFDM